MRYGRWVSEVRIEQCIISTELRTMGTLQLDKGTSRAQGSLPPLPLCFKALPSSGDVLKLPLPPVICFSLPTFL